MDQETIDAAALALDLNGARDEKRKRTRSRSRDRKRTRSRSRDRKRSRSRERRRSRYYHSLFQKNYSKIWQNPQNLSGIRCSKIGFQSVSRPVDKVPLSPCGQSE